MYCRRAGPVEYKKNKTFKAQYYPIKYIWPEKISHICMYTIQLNKSADNVPVQIMHCFYFLPKTTTDNWILTFFAEDIICRNRNIRRWDLRFALFCCGVNPVHFTIDNACYRYCTILVSEFEKKTGTEVPTTENNIHHGIFAMYLDTLCTRRSILLIYSKTHMIAISEQNNKYLERYKTYAPSWWFIMLFFSNPRQVSLYTSRLPATNDPVSAKQTLRIWVKHSKQRITNWMLILWDVMQVKYDFDSKLKSDTNNATPMSILYIYIHWLPARRDAILLWWPRANYIIKVFGHILLCIFCTVISWK